MAAPSAFTMYAENLSILSLTDLASATVNMILVASTYTPDADESGHDLYSDITGELSTGNGYTSGGVALASKVVTAITNGYKFSSANVSWTASGAGIPAWRYAVMRVVGSLWGKTSPLIGYFVGDSAPADIPLTAAGNPLQINCPAAGWFTVTKP